ncbi:MAG TPA: calcium-binding protein, partial [Inquilinus sp.]
DGIDVIGYEVSPAAVSINLATGFASGGHATGDRWTNIEDVGGSAFGDRLVGNDGSNVLWGNGGADYLFGLAGADVLHGGDGIDVIGYEVSPAAVSINLAAGFASGGHATGDRWTNIEDVGGSAFNDTLVGNAGSNVLWGNGGDDILEGGAGADRMEGAGGTDTVRYSGSASAIVVDLSAGRGSAGDAAGDRLGSIENVAGSSHHDRVSGNGGANVLDGGNGNDILEGLGGADSLQGGGGDDVLRGGAAADQLDGGAGNDIASYYGGTVGVTVDLAAGTGSGGDAQGDTFAGIENVNGSQANDALTGNAGTNVLAGWDGDDVLRGGAGADTLDGGNGDDLASYFAGTVGVTVDLAAGAGTGGDAQGDTYVGIENVNGSTVADRIVGNALANVLNGWAGQDVLTGGAGADLFAFTAASHSVVGAADLVTDFSHAQGDLVDLSAIDADTGAAGDQAFTFIGSGLYTSLAGQLRAVVASPGITTIAGDLNGDGISDFHIQLTGNLTLVAGDFVL